MCNNSPAESTSPENGWRWSVGPIPGRRRQSERRERDGSPGVWGGRGRRREKGGGEGRPSPPDFQGPARAHRTPPEPRRFPRRGPLSRGEPIPGRPALHKEKRTLPGAPAGFSGIGRVTALDASRRPSPPLRIRGSEPDSLSIGRGQRRPSPVPSERRSPISQDRLTHVQLLFTWNPSPLRPSKFSFEYLLLPPRSAPAAAPPGPAP